jgi:hypothetical protein
MNMMEGKVVGIEKDLFHHLIAIVPPAISDILHIAPWPYALQADGERPTTPLRGDPLLYPVLRLSYDSYF